ncbi:diguanylate cyclase (GGDEF)-like protein [Treponema rectale]|uniref:diguanylate cyclase n=1 Tax=Treponema rectale TaxID=744512 RepID=A0A840SF04_9SPIR|nr:diguanylate cyclase [Treponema rectale]MBB5218738.1 diguanylate cyclase (GGDEF)-like protein [Treponema rectale]
MKVHSKKNSLVVIPAIIIVLISGLFFSIQKFDEYRLKVNLSVFQEREMKSSVENFIKIIDFMRKDMIANLEKKGVKYTEDSIKNATLTFVRHVVHEANFANGAYLWINEVVDFNGGENYGIRQVHGNLPETEGMFLSTSMKDAKGNTPYLTELEGIKEKGEILYRYYFKEYRSDNVSEKITYAKLYEPYNWIVCTGTYLNSLYEPAGGVSNKSKLIFYTLCMILFTLSVLLFVYIVAVNFISSRKLIRETESLRGNLATDALTGACSRRYGESLLKEYYNNFISSGKNYSLAILDIDNFKKINDTYGHKSGDDVIKVMVNTIKEFQNSDDHIIRWGGDEFILTYNNLSGSLDSVLGKINKKNSQQTVITDSGEKINYTISIGASIFNSKDRSYVDAIKRIDDALYLAKRKKNTYYIL